MPLQSSHFSKQSDRHRCHRRGSVLMAYSLIVVTLTALASLAVDYGHVQLVKTQLQTAVDAAARAAAQQLTTGSSAMQIAAASSSAISTAALNISDKSPVVVDPSDVLIGNYDKTQSPAFSTSRSPANAVRVTARRQSSRGNAVELFFASILGVRTCDVTATSLVAVNPPMSSYGIAGVQHASFASAGVLAQINGDIASNGDINIGNPLGLLVRVTGNAQSYGGYVSHGSLAQIGGSTAALSSAVNYPTVLLPTTNANASISSYLDAQSNFIGIGFVSIPGGVYVVHDLNLLADVRMDLQGPVTFYVTGSFNIAASVTLLGTNNATPSNFTVNVTATGSVNFVATILAPIAMNLYAPDTAININVGVSSYSGQLVGKTLDINLPVLGTFTEVKPAIPPQTVSFVKE